MSIRSNALNILPNANFGALPTGFSAQSAGLALPNVPNFGFDSRWPFDGTDTAENITDNITWIKGAAHGQSRFLLRA